MRIRQCATHINIGGVPVCASHLNEFVKDLESGLVVSGFSVPPTPNSLYGGEIRLVTSLQYLLARPTIAPKPMADTSSLPIRRVGKVDVDIEVI
jgi:hypothetical protein